MLLPFVIIQAAKNVSLPEEVTQRFQQTKDLVNQSVNSLTQSAQQIGESWKATATQTSGEALDKITTTFGQAKLSLEQTVQATEKLKDTTSVAVQTAISSSINDWFQQHPILLRLVQILGWASNHPIISLVIFIFALAIIWSLIRAIGRLIESTSLSLLQIPLKLLQAVLKLGFVSLTKVSRLTVKQPTNAQTSDTTPSLPPPLSPAVDKDKQQRLVEISTRLEEIQKEQNELLQEAATILASEKAEIKSHSKHYIVG